MMNEKRYPFSMIKNGHNVELAYNHQWIICREMEDGEHEWDDKAFEYFNKLSAVYSNAMGCPVYFATGEEYGVLKEASSWAICYRDRKTTKTNPPRRLRGQKGRYGRKKKRIYPLHVERRKLAQLRELP